MLVEVMGLVLKVRRVLGGGGVRLVWVMEEMKFVWWRVRVKWRLYFVLGIEVRFSLVWEVFWRWERVL